MFNLAKEGVMKKRWLSGTFIACYLTALAWGIVAHAMHFTVNSHPAMYYLVWDMFCGWSAYETRFHVVGEGEDGKYYQLAPGPWPHFSPFGDLPRQHYDAYGTTFHKSALNTLRHTEHGPMRRILVFQECWHKKYNLPEHLWNIRFEEPKETYSYFWPYSSFTAEGDVITRNTDYINYSTAMSITDNPRLLSDARRGRPFFAVNPMASDDSPMSQDPTAWAGPSLSGRPYAN